MKVSSLAPLLLLAIVAQPADFISLTGKCPTVRLPNGRVRGRTRGRIIRFSCNEGFTLVGNRYSNCIRGQWDTPTPVCVNARCSTPPTPDHALVASKYYGAILLFFCEPGYSLVGPAEIYCDGREWNGTVPHCRDTTAEAPTQCDFEKTDLCWWEQDPEHDFDWRRHNFETPSSHIGTGPTHDHTLGPGNDGHYLYIEASGRLVNETARIVSPIYKASYTDGGCFSFWYHMFGASIGALNVYFKPEKNSTGQLMFSKQGNQGNHWLHGIFNLPKAEKGFQIVIEGVRGNTYVSDIAIDDVAILQGDKCQNTSKAENEGVTESDDDQIEQVNAQLSCRGQCKNVMTSNLTTAKDLSQTCLCTIDCAEHFICCPDYAEYCILGPTEDSVTEVTEVTTVIHDAIIGPPVKKDNVTDIATMRPDDKGISIYPKDEIDPVTLKPPTTTTTTIATTTTTASPVTNVTRPKTVKPLITTERTTLTTNATTKLIQTTKETPVPETSTTERYVPIAAPPDLDVVRQDVEKLHHSGVKISMPGIISLVVGILTGVTITVMVAIFVLRRRKTYKRSANGSALSEDSDVRFLTSDEILDFTLARPSENDET
nr:uncharacterized protein LOC116431082 [Nomia melanderi]